MTRPNHAVLLFTGIPAWLSSTDMQTNLPRLALINNSQPDSENGTVKLRFGDLQHLLHPIPISCMQMSSHLCTSYRFNTTSCHIGGSDALILHMTGNEDKCLI